jgi:hypothetical protein
MNRITALSKRITRHIDGKYDEKGKMLAICATNVKIFAERNENWFGQECLVWKIATKNWRER